MTQPDKLAQVVADASAGRLARAAPETPDDARFKSLPLPQQIAEQEIDARYPDEVRAYHVAAGQFVDLSPETAEEGFRAGHLRFDKDQELHVQLADGGTGTVDAADLGPILDSGGQLISPRQARDAQLARKYGGAAGTLGAGALGVASGLTGGISDELLGFGGGEATEAARFLKEQHPLAAGLGEGAGLVGGALLNPEAGLGKLAESGAERAVGTGATSFMGRLAQRGIAAGARGAAEAAQLAHTEAVSEEALGAPPLTAEKYWASLGEAALFGAALGAPSPLVEAGVRGVTGLAAKSFGFMAKGIGKAYARAASGIAGGGEDIIREAGIQNTSAEARALRKDLLEIDKVRDSTAREVREHVDTMLKGTDALTEEAKGGLKREYVRAAVAKGEPEAVARHSADTIASARGEVQAMLADADTFGQKQLLTRMDSELGRYESRIAAAGKAGDNAEQFALIDDAKRAVGRWTRATKQTSIRAASDPITLRQAQATYERLDGLYEGLRANLENEGVWGKAAADQKAINAAWSEHIAADKQFRSAVATVVGEERFGGKIYGADPQKITAYVSGLTNPDKDLIHQAFGKYTKAARDLAKAVGESYDLPPAKAAQVQAVVSASAAADKTLAKAGERLAKVNQLRALLAAEGHGAGPVVHGAIGAALVSGHPVGAALGLMSSALTSPGKSILRLAQLEHMAASFDQKMGGRVRAFLARDAEATERRPLHAVQRARQGQRARAASVAAAEAAAVRQEYARRAGAVRQWQENPAVLQARIADHVQTLQQDAPQVARALVSVAARASAFLASKLPQPAKADPLFGKEGAPSASEQAKFLRYARAVEDPASVAEDLARGRVSYEGVEALRAVYPSVYAELRGGVMRELSARKGLSYQQRVQLGVLFDVTAAPSMAPESVKAAQAMYATPPEKAPAPGKAAGKPLPVARSTPTPEQRLEQPQSS